MDVATKTTEIASTRVVEAGAIRTRAILTRIARAAAGLVALGSLAVLAGYVLHIGNLVDLRPDWPGVSPLTAIALLCLALSIATDAGAPSRLGWVAVAAGIATLASHAGSGRDVLDPLLASHVFQFNVLRAGCMAIPTATCLIALGAADIGRGRPKLADRLAAVALFISTFAVLDEVYESQSLRAISLFSTMSPQIAVAILLLALASLAVRPRAGFAAVVASDGAGGASTRRLIAFTPLPPLLGLLLARTAELHRLNVGAAMAALVVLTIVPLALLVLRGGRILDALDRERRAAAAVERAREAELRLIADALPVLVALVDRDLVYRFANRAYESWLGIKPEDVVGRSIPDVVGPQGMAERQAHIAAVLAGFEARFELAWPYADGRPRAAEVRYLPRLRDGSVDGFFVFVADVTERRAREAQLVESNFELEERVEARTRERDQIWQSSKDMLCIATLDGRIVNVNPAWTATLGWTHDELVAGPFIHFVHPDDVAATMAAAADLSAGRPALDFVNRYRHADGGWRWLSWNAVPDGDRIYASIRDISDARAAAERERALEDALRQAQKMEAVGQLTGGLAHDFNNLLAGITGSLDLISRRVEQGRTGEISRYIDAAQGAAARAAALTHRLLAFSRRQTLDPKPTDAAALLAGLQDLVRRTVGPAIGVEIAAEGDLWPVLVDPNQLENAVLNLCLNARDAMPDGGRITVSAGNETLGAGEAAAAELAAGAYVALRVADTGTGMPPEVIARIFDPFYTTKPLGQGTGLGLSMIYGFARQSGGRVAVTSEVGRGTTMTLLLPRYLGAAEGIAPAPAVLAPQPARGGTMLVVDDEPTVRMLIVEVLGDLGYRVLEAADGAGGLDVLRSPAALDLLVTDVGLPGGLNGRQLAEAARALRPGLPVLLVTGYAEASVLDAGALEPGMRVLSKPFAMDVLGATVKEMLARSAVSAAAGSPPAARARPGS